MRHLLCIAIYALALAVIWSIAIAAPPSGIYALYRPKIAVGPAARGVTVNVTWAEIEPQSGVYDWSAIDAGIAAATGRPVKLGVEGGVFAPAWLYAEGAADLRMTWPFAFGPRMCSTARFPLPWDAVFVGAWNRLTAALGARYAGNGQVVAVAVSSVMAKDLEDVLPTAAPTACPHPIDPQAAWLAAGYRPDLIAGALGATLPAYVAAFPTQSLVLETGGWPWPAIDNDGHATGAPDYALGAALDAQFVDGADGRAILQNDALAAGAWTWQPPVDGAVVADQENQALGSKSCVDNGGVSPCNARDMLTAMLAKAAGQHATFIEFYVPDINNPDLAGLFGSFAP